MMFPSHLLATLLGCALLALVRPVSPREWLLAVSFGVLIDLDHVLQFPAYVATHGWSAATPAAMLEWGGAWQGFMHTPWALALVLPACFVFTSWFPLAFWGLHMVQDFVIARHLVRFGGPIEWAIDVALLAVLTMLVLRDHRAHGGGLALGQHVWTRVAMALPRR